MIAVIPARGGSKRLPRKNILPFNGKPLIHWVIKTCIQSQLFDDVIVSTEDPEISDISVKDGASVHKRHKNLAQDHSTVVEVCTDVLIARNCEIFCCVYPTAVLLTVSDLITSYEKFIKVRCDTLISTAKFEFSPFEALIKRDDGFFERLLPSYHHKQSQEFPETVVDAGAFYWAKKEQFLCDKSFYTKKLSNFELSADKTIDINTKDDFKRLQKMSC